MIPPVPNPQPSFPRLFAPSLTNQLATGLLQTRLFTRKKGRKALQPGGTSTAELHKRHGWVCSGQDWSVPARSDSQTDNDSEPATS